VNTVTDGVLSAKQNFVDSLGGSSLPEQITSSSPPMFNQPAPQTTQPLSLVGKPAPITRSRMGQSEEAVRNKRKNQAGYY
jgi:hypothetical protein